MDAVKKSFPGEAPQWFNAVAISALLSALSFLYGRDQVSSNIADLERRVVVIEEQLKFSANLQAVRYEQIQEELREIKAAIQVAHPINGGRDQ